MALKENYFEKPKKPRPRPTVRDYERMYAASAVESEDAIKAPDLVPSTAPEELAPIGSILAPNRRPNGSILAPNNTPQLGQTDGNWLQNDPLLAPNRRPNGSILAPIESQSEADRKIARLPRLQRSVLDLIFSATIAEGGRESSPLPAKCLADAACSTNRAVKKAISRMIEGGFFSRAEHRRGRGGFTVYGFSEAVFQSLRRRNTPPNGSILAPQMAPISPSSSSYNSKNLKTTTTAANDLPPEWQAVDFSALREMNLHIGETQLKQFWRAGLDPGVVQQSAFHFAYALQHTDLRQKIRTDPLSYFVGSVLGNGAYAAPQGYAAYRRRVIESVLAQKAEDDRDREQHQERPRELTPEDGGMDEKPALVLQRQTMKDVT